MARTDDVDDGQKPHPTRHIDAIVSDSPQEVDKTVRKVEVSSNEEWGTIGLPIFLSSEELDKQGIDPEEADQAIVRVEDGFLLIDPE